MFVEHRLVNIQEEKSKKTITDTWDVKWVFCRNASSFFGIKRNRISLYGWDQKYLKEDKEANRQTDIK